MVAQLRILFVLVVTRKDILRQCVTLEKHSHGHILHTKTRLSRKYTPMKTRTLVNQRMLTVEMIRSMGLCAKNPLQVANVHEMSIVHDNTKPVFYSPVQPEIVMTIWEQISNVMDPEVCVATPVEHCVYETK